MGVGVVEYVNRVQLQGHVRRAGLHGHDHVRVGLKTQQKQ